MNDLEIVAEATRLRVGNIWQGSWPNCAHVAVALSFDVDHETPWIRDEDFSNVAMSMGAYGSHSALPRILSTLKARSLPATFFIPGLISLLHPGDIEKISKDNHEVALHGWLHERPDLLDREVELDVLHRSISRLEKCSGVVPLGIRSPSFAVSKNSISLATEVGLIYDSSLMAHDDPYEVVVDGQRSGLVEIPTDWGRDDAAYFVMDRYSSLRAVANPKDVIEGWELEFQEVVKEGGLFQLTLHPDLIGRRGRWNAFETFLDKITAIPNVGFATHIQVARHVSKGLIS
jgi:peptidoglycan/xylan/chitin deacetylase (PgdA/CDA1 family)